MTLHRRWALLSSGGVARLVLAFGISILIARALGPAAFGTYAVLGGLAAVVGALADLGLSDTVVPRLVRAEPIERSRLIAAFVTARIGLALVVTVVGTALARLFAGVIDPALVALALAGMVVTAIGGCAGTLLQASGRFAALAILPVVNSAVTLVAAAGLALLGGLTIASAIVWLGIVPAIVAAIVGGAAVPAAWRVRRLIVDLALVRRASWIGLANSLAMLGSTIDLFLVSALLGGPAAGLYALAVSIAGKADVLSANLYTVLLPAAGKERIGKRDSLARVAPVVLLVVLAAIVAGPAVTLAYGQAFAAAGGIIAWLLVAVAVDLLVAHLQPVAVAAGRTRLVALAEVVRLVVLAGTLPPLVIAIGPAGAALARIAGRLAFAAVLARQPIDRYSASNAADAVVRS